MITNPKVGMRIRYRKDGSVFSEKLATILIINHYHKHGLMVSFDDTLHGKHEFSSNCAEYDQVFNTPEEEAADQLKRQDQIRREQHAAKYL